VIEAGGCTRPDERCLVCKRRQWYALYNIHGRQLIDRVWDGGVGEAAKLILLVEDDPDVGPVLEHILISAGYRVHLVPTFLEAEALLDARPYDLVLTDIMLPDGNGIGIADAARERGIASVVVTGHAFQRPAEELARHEVLLKPVRARELVGAIERRLAARK
jgi:DNA-binding response OmpR family regulator